MMNEKLSLATSYCDDFFKNRLNQQAHTWVVGFPN